jgi:septum formation protein
MTLNDIQIILASASPRRIELLRQIGVRVRAQSVDIDETRLPGEPALDFVQRLALEKARRGIELIENSQGLPILGSDTIIELAGDVLGKPENRRHAKQMLQQMSGREHTVHTSVAIITKDKTLLDTSSSKVYFADLAESEIDAYLATGEADDKAGAYAIQGIAAQFIKSINGSYSGIMGLPLYETAQLLKQCGIKPLNDYNNK